MSKEKICFVIINLGKGGAETVLADLANRFTEKYEVHICVFDSLLVQKVDTRCRIHPLIHFKIPSFLKLFLVPLLSFRLYKYLKKNNIINVISFLERANYTNAFLKYFNSKLNHIITVNTALSQWYKKGTVAGNTGIFLIKKLYPRANHLACCSNYTAHEMNSIFHVQPDKIHTIYNGIDIKKIDTLKSAKINLDIDTYTFIHVGSFYEGKNHLLLLEGFKKFIESGRKAKLILIGRGYTKDKIASVVREDESLQHNVIIPDNVENQYAYMYQANCFVLTSNFEGLPTVIMEAFACGLNVISTDCISGPRELLTEPVNITTQLVNENEIGKYGILCPVHNATLLFKAMCDIFDDKDLAQAQKMNIEKIKTTFDIKIMAEKYERLFRFR